MTRSIRGVRDTIPGGYVLGRPHGAAGAATLIPLGSFATPGFVAQTTIQIGGPAGGDLSGTYPNPSVFGLRGIPLSATPPTDGQVLTYVTADTEWEAKTLPVTHGIPAGGSAHQVLTKIDGTDYNVDWETPSGGSGGGAASIKDDGTNVYIAMSDSSGQLVLDSLGNPIFSLEVFPVAALQNALPMAMIAASLRF